jgi:hypothetical protein
VGDQLALALLITMWLLSTSQKKSRRLDQYLACTNFLIMLP